MDDLKTYSKKSGPVKVKQTSVALTIEQHNFIQKNGLNASRLLRDLLDDFIVDHATKEREDKEHLED